MAVLDDIRDGKGLKPITFNCFTCQNDNCMASGSKTTTYQCPGYKHKKTNADSIRAMTNEELADKFEEIQLNAIKAYGNDHLLLKGELKKYWLDWLKQEAEE
jgi:hypothetical protein